MKKIVLLFVALAMMNGLVFGQVKYDGAFGKGIRFKTNDESFGLKVGVRVQPRWDFVSDTKTGKLEQQAWVARSRLKFDGFMLEKDLRYKIEFDVVKGYVRDALVKYRFAKHSDIWFGQGKLPGNRERVVSSANLQFVNRSITNNNFNIDRDVGVQFHHYFELGSTMIIRDKYAISTGNGILNKRFKAAPSVTAQIEILPFGEFQKKGDYSSGDLEREETLKLAAAVSVDYNWQSYKSHSHIGMYLDGAERDLFTLNADILFKLRGWSWMTEYGYRSSPGKSPIVYNDAGQPLKAFYTGWGITSQMGYLFRSNWEVAVRYSSSIPDKLEDIYGNSVSIYREQHDYTLGFSKYIVGHKLKIQTDVTYRTTNSENDLVIARLQMEIHF